MMWGDGYMGWFGWLVMVAWWVLVIAGIVLLVNGGWRRASAGTSARERLDDRLASGELTIDEYRERREALR